jgi:hypothetical protein
MTSKILPFTPIVPDYIRKEIARWCLYDIGRFQRESANKPSDEIVSFCVIFGGKELEQSQSTLGRIKPLVEQRKREVLTMMQAARKAKKRGAVNHVS